MSVTSRKRLLAELKNKKYRDAYNAEHVKTMIPIQARVLREQRGWSQGQLAERMKTTQSVISRLEDPNYGKLSLSSLLKQASAFDVALLVKFVPFPRLLHEFEDASPEALSAHEFIAELPKLERWANQDTQASMLGSQPLFTAGRGANLMEEVPTGRNSSIQEVKRSLEPTATRPYNRGTQSLARQLTIQKDTTRSLEVLDGAA